MDKIKTWFFASILVLSFFAVAKVNASPLVLNNSPISELAGWVTVETGKTISFADSAHTPISLNIPDSSQVDPWLIFESTANNAGLYIQQVDQIYIVSSNNKLKPEEEEFEPFYYQLNTYTYQVFPSNLQDIERALSSLINVWQQQEQAKIENPIPKFTVQASSVNSSIIVTVPPSLKSDVETIVNTLNKPEKQLLIEAVIFETSNLDFQAVGIDYRNLDLGTGLSIDFGNATGPLNTITTGVGISYSKNGTIQGLIKALDTSDETSILSTPVIRVINRKSGRVDVGQEVPFITSTQTGESGQITNNIVRQTVGITLDVKPIVQPDGSIDITLTTTAGSISDDSSASDIITNNRTVRTVINSRDGETVYLGGLITDEMKKGVVGVPGLKDVPILGGLFASKETRKNKTKLSIFLKASII